MNRSKLIAVITGAISIILAIAYLMIVQLLDFRGEMQPAPQSQLLQPSVAITHLTSKSHSWSVGSDTLLDC